jgi:hypothetical protein
MLPSRTPTSRIAPHISLKRLIGPVRSAGRVYRRIPSGCQEAIHLALGGSLGSGQSQQLVDPGGRCGA